MVSWRDSGSDYSELYINNKLIGSINYYNDSGESEGFMFGYHFGLRYYEGDNEYTEELSMDKVKYMVLEKVKEDFNKDVEELNGFLREIERKY